MDRLALLGLGLLLPALFALFKLAQFHRFELMWDSGVMANLAFNAAHGDGLTSSVIAGRSYLSVHFAFTVALLAPLVRLWPSTAVLALAHGLAVGSAAYAAYRLGWKVCGGPWAGWMIALLAASHPFFHDIEGSVLDNSIFALPLFLWGALAWESGRRGWALLCALLLLTTRETMPLLFAGLGLYGLLRTDDRRARAACLGLIALSAALLFAELKIIERAREGFQGQDPWHLFKASGGSPVAVLLRPWALAWPPGKLLPLLKALLGLGFLPLAAGATLLPAFLLWLPQGLADGGTMYNALIGHNAVYVFGPLVWACAHGLRRLGRRAWLAPVLLAVSGVGFLRSARFLMPPGMNPAAWRQAGPRAMAHIPPDAPLWCDEFFLPHLGMRRQVKSLMRTGDPYFEPGLFSPERVLYSEHWARLTEPAVRERVFSELRERGFIEVFREGDLVVLADPKSL